MKLRYLVCFALGLCSQAGAQEANWPKRTVTFVIPFAAGAAADIGARVLANELAAKWKQPVIVENRPGGDSLIAIRSVIGSKDNHVLLFAAAGSLSVHPFKYKTLDYNRSSELTPVAGISSTLVGIVASEKSGFVSIEQVVERARRSPGSLSLVTIPGITELVWDAFAKSRDIDVVKVPYSNILAGIQDVSTGRVDVAMVGYAIFQPVLQSNSIRLLAVTSSQRVGLSPDTPTVQELGFPELFLEGLVGLFANKALDGKTIAAISKDIVSAASTPQVTERLVATGQIPKPELAEEFTKSVEAQEAQVKRIVETYGILPK